MKICTRVEHTGPHRLVRSRVDESTRVDSKNDDYKLKFSGPGTHNIEFSRVGYLNWTIFHVPCPVRPDKRCSAEAFCRLHYCARLFHFYIRNRTWYLEFCDWFSSIAKASVDFIRNFLKKREEEKCFFTFVWYIQKKILKKYYFFKIVFFQNIDDFSSSFFESTQVDSSTLDSTIRIVRQFYTSIVIFRLVTCFLRSVDQL